MIDSDSSIDEVKGRNSETRESFDSTLGIYENGKYILQQYRDKKAQSIKTKLQKEEKKLKEVARRERKKLEEQIACERFATERPVDGTTKGHVRNKGKELEMERMAGVQQKTCQT